MSEPPALPLARRRILIVDDEASILGVLEAALRDAGADVSTAGDGTAALEAVEGATPDLILLDLAMPRMSGWEVLERLSSRARTAVIPVVLETSAEDFPSFDRARKRGVAAFISKPFRLHEVVETCRRIFEGARPLQGKPAAEARAPGVQLQDRYGSPLASGSLLDLDADGAQVELDTALMPAQLVSLTIQKADGDTTVSAEVRWVTRIGDRYHHGLLIRAE